jgi:hypothetical protein
MLGQYNRHIKTHEGEDIPEIILVNETVSLFRWFRNQYQAGYIDTMPEEYTIRDCSVFPHPNNRIPKSQISSTKLQINLKFQYSMTQTYLGFLF